MMRVLERLPFASVAVPSFPVWLCICWLAALLGLLVWWPSIKREKLARVLACVGLVAVATLIRWRYLQPARIVVLDVGQGDAILVQDGPHAILVDAGPDDAVAHALSDLCQVEPAVKWVNDVLVGGLKVCGILSEGTSDLETGGMQNVSVGIGVNLGTAAFSKELDGIAGAVALANGHTRNEFAAHVACELKRLVADDASIAKMTAEYKRLLIAPAPEGAFSA